MRLGCRPAVAAGLLLALVASACSSTTRLDSATGTLGGFEVADEEVGIIGLGAGRGADELGVAGGGDPTALGDSTALGDPETTTGNGTDAGDGARGPGLGGAPAPGTAGGGGGVTAGGGGRAGLVPGGPGVTDSEILIGVEAAENINQATAVVGAETNNPEESDVAAALAEWVNANGGMGGRSVRLVIHEKDVTRGTWEQHAQAACSRFTEDTRVFAVISSSVGGNESLASCLAAKGVPVVELNYWPFDAEAYRRLGRYLYQPSRMIPDRYAAAYVDGLVAMGFFENARIGLIRFDQPVFERMAEAIKARLAVHGLSVVDEQATITPRGVSDFGAMGGQIGNALISFRSNQVSHVLFAEYNGMLPFLLLNAAEAQGYRPKYGFQSNNLPETQADEQAPQQLAGAMVVGWMPPNDVGMVFDQRGGTYARCLDIVAGAGGSERGRRLYGGYGCDAFMFLKHALDRASALTASGLEDAVHRLGTSFDSPFTYATSFFPGRHDGAAAVRYSVYDPQCQCFRYANDRIDRVA
ncbi:MAG TPA: ABC transporter substrate-binding protein [Acidimicrobiales bacterium]